MLTLLAVHADAHATPTTVLPAGAIAHVKGCWQAADERWTFRAKGTSGLEIIREVKEPNDPDLAVRARIPRDLLYDASPPSFAFGAAGRIHALMFVFTFHQDPRRKWLDVWVYSSHSPSQGFHSTGGHFEADVCR